MQEEKKAPARPDPQEAFWLELGPADPEMEDPRQAVLPYADPALPPQIQALEYLDDAQQPQ